MKNVYWSEIKEERKIFLLSKFHDYSFHHLLRQIREQPLSLTVDGAFRRFAYHFFTVFSHCFSRLFHLLLVSLAIIINLVFHRLDLVDDLLNARHKLADSREFLQKIYQKYKRLLFSYLLKLLHHHLLLF